MKRFFELLWDKAEADYKTNVLLVINPKSEAVYLDAGCDDGMFSTQIAQKIGTKSILGIEINKEGAKQATSRGIKVYATDLNQAFPLADNSVDIITANMVIEHLYEPDRFLREVYRVLKPGGYAVVSTDNLASWHNIFALLLGWQPFSLANTSDKKQGLGNPMAIHRGENAALNSWRHHKVFAFQGLKELPETNGLKVEKLLGSGYFPFIFSKVICKIDKRHSVFLTLKLSKAQMLR
jgi:SAM-dependent methyltransferase